MWTCARIHVFRVRMPETCKRQRGRVLYICAFSHDDDDDYDESAKGLNSPPPPRQRDTFEK